MAELVDASASETDEQSWKFESSWPHHIICIKFSHYIEYNQMKKRFLIPCVTSIMLLASCGAVSPDPSYGCDFNTPEFFLARLDSKNTKLSLYSGKTTVEDDGSIKDALFARDSYVAKNECKPTTKDYFCYSTILGSSNTGMTFVEMYVFKDGNIRIDYKEMAYKKISFYHEMDVNDACEVYDMVKEKIDNAK